MRNICYRLQETEYQMCPGCGLSQTAVYLVKEKMTFSLEQKKAKALLQITCLSTAMLTYRSALKLNKAQHKTNLPVCSQIMVLKYWSERCSIVAQQNDVTGDMEFWNFYKAVFVFQKWKKITRASNKSLDQVPRYCGES